LIFYNFTLSSLQAWYRRGKANASLKNYEDAVCDLEVAVKMEPSLSGKRQIENELKLISDQYKKTCTSLDKSNKSNLGYSQ